MTATSLGGDGCTASCKHESGYVCTVPGLACNRFDVIIDTPANGTFTTASSITITGHYTTLLPGTAAVTVNGVAAQLVQPSAAHLLHTASRSARRRSSTRSTSR